MSKSLGITFVLLGASVLSMAASGNPQRNRADCRTFFVAVRLYTDHCVCENRNLGVKQITPAFFQECMKGDSCADFPLSGQSALIRGGHGWQGEVDALLAS